MKHYLKFTSCNLLCLLAIVCFLYGGVSMWLPLLVIVVLAIGGDTLLAPDMSAPVYQRPWILNAQLYLNLPLLLLANFALLWQCTAGDALGFGAWAQQTLDWPLLSLKAATTSGHCLGGFLGLGLFFGIAGTNVAHELVHRTWSPLDLNIGRWLLAFTWDGEFAIEHVYGHHRKIATFEDPVSARRGETFFAFFCRSMVGCHRSAWRIEKDFLRKRGLPLWSHHNRLLGSWAMSLTLAVLSLLIFGLPGLGLHFALALYGKAYLELVNYIEHYGLVRKPQTPVLLRHSWNTNARISSYVLYNLTRHSHHHAVGHLPFWKLKPQHEAPCLPYGYMTMIVFALVPPLFRRVMEPALQSWDSQQASPEELQLLEMQRA